MTATKSLLRKGLVLQALRSEPSGTGTEVELAVVGAGPAGMSAAVAAADAGCRVAVLDLSARPGGQFWKWGPATAAGRFHHDWSRFIALEERFSRHQEAGGIDYRPSHFVFTLEPAGSPSAGFVVHAVADERYRMGVAITARKVLVATGAYDRQLPMPGWTLPGVISAGAAQALLKGSGVLPGRRVVVAGAGPFLMPVAAGLVQAGARVVAVAEASEPLDYLRSPRVLAGSRRKLSEAVSYLTVLARHRVPLLRRHAVIEATGQDQLERVTLARIDRDWRPVSGTERRVEADVLAAGYGFLPQIELLAGAGAELRSDVDGSLVAAVGTDQQTSVSGLFAAGETTGVGGAELACLEGVTAGLAAAASLGHRSSLPYQADRRRATSLRRFAAVMHAVHGVQSGWTGWPNAETVVCRCEEVSLADLRAAQDLGADDTRSIKLLTRAGMGWCQGRMCGYAVGALLGEVGVAPTRRPLAQPVPLRVLADLTETLSPRKSNLL